MPKTIKIRKGVNIKLLGEAEKVYGNATIPSQIALKPTDFPGLMPKMAVKVGDKVKAGTVVFFDKYNEKVKFTSPASGEIAEIRRGEKRYILEVVINTDSEIEYESFTPPDIASGNREEILNAILNAGLWPSFKQRPFDCIANPQAKPKAIFISAFSSAPLAVDFDFVVHGNGDIFQKGLDAIAKLTDGKVHLNVNIDLLASKVFTNSKNVQINNVTGPHPAGNVGIQIHHIDPINKGEVAWCLTPQDVLMIGSFFKHAKYDASKVIAVAGAACNKPRYYKTFGGACVQGIIVDAGIKEGSRIISGNVLTGTQITENGFLGYYDSQITAIPEGKEQQFLGWLAPNLNKFSLSRTFLSYLTPNKKYNLNTNLNGEERAYVMTGQYEDVLPMDIYPVHLIKAMMINDIDAMESLGVYEVAPEDFALCEYACTSKMEVQSIVRKALDDLKIELS